MTSLLIFGALFTPVFLGYAQAGNRFVCYHTNWSQYRTGVARFTPEDIDPFLCTHILYSFAKLSDYRPYVLTPYEWNDDTYDNNYAKVTNLKLVNPDLKVLLAVGGCTHGVAKFREMAATQESRQHFIDDAITFLRDRNFDGLDLDWEFPVGEQDAIKFSNLCEELREAFEAEAQETGRSRLLLSAAVAAGYTYINGGGYDIPVVSGAVDFLNLMAYDLYLHYGDYKTGHHSGLHSVAGDSYDDSRRVVEFAVNEWLDGGCPPNKLTLGIGTYGRSFTLTGTQTGIFAPASGAIAGPYTNEAGYWSYYEICDKLAGGYTRVFDPNRGVPYAYGDGQWVGYDDVDSINTKVDFLKYHGLGGAMIWAIDLDDFTGTFCHQGKYPLLTAIKTALNSGVSDPDSDPDPSTTAATTATIIPTTKATTRTTTTPSSTSNSGGNGDNGETDPNPNFCVGKADGLYADPNDCISYYQCYSNGHTAHFSCHYTNVFNPLISNCDWPDQYVCPSPNGDETSSTLGPTTAATTVTSGPTNAATTVTTPTDVPNGGIEADFCSRYNKDIGLHSNPYDCQKYYSCWCDPNNRYTSPWSCPDGNVFNPDRSSCDWPSNYDCSAINDGAADVDVTPEIYQPDLEPTLPSECVEEDFCSRYSMADGLYPNPCNCNQYYRCGGNGYTEVFSCGETLVFNPNNNYCDWPENYSCP